MGEEYSYQYRKKLEREETVRRKKLMNENDRANTSNNLDKSNNNDQDRSFNDSFTLQRKNSSLSSHRATPL